MPYSCLGEAVVSPPILAVSPETWEESRIITVTGKDDEYLDGDQRYEVEVRTLFTADPEYRDAKLVIRTGMINLDEATDRSLTECPLGYFGVNPDCTPCPAGTYGKTTKGTVTEAATCVPCAPGTYGAAAASAYGPAQIRNFERHPCQPCREGTFSRDPGASVCQACPASSPGEPRYCGFGAMNPVPLNWSSTTAGFGRLPRIFGKHALGFV